MLLEYVSGTTKCYPDFCEVPTFVLTGRHVEKTVTTIDIILWCKKQMDLIPQSRMTFKI